MCNLYSQNQNRHGTVARVAQGVQGVLGVPWDLATPPAQFVLVYLSFLIHPELPEVRGKSNQDVSGCQTFLLMQPRRA